MFIFSLMFNWLSNILGCMYGGCFLVFIVVLVVRMVNRGNELFIVFKVDLVVNYN